MNADTAPPAAGPLALPAAGPLALPAAGPLALPAAGPLALNDVVAEIAARRDEFDRLSHVPRDMIATMKRAGIFRASTPQCFGGDALPPAAFLRMLETIAVADGSAAWVAAFGSANTYLAALPRETQREIYASGPDQVFAGALYPMQMARAAPGGWLATGRWRFASGCLGADWIGVGIGVETSNGVTPLIAVGRAADAEIVENWDVVGMRGTGSHDVRLQDRFFAREWTCARAAGGVIDEPLFRYPAVAYQAAVHAACNVGLARAALDIVVGMAGGGPGIMNGPPLSDRAYYRIELGRAEAQWQAARAFFYAAPERAWDVLLAGDPVPPELANLLRLSATHAAHTCAEIVQHMYRIAGMTAIFRTNRLQQLVRDTMVVTQHAALTESTFENAGAILAGVAPRGIYP